MQKALRKYAYILFIAPAFAWICVFTVYPFFYSFYISITDMSMLRLGRENIIGLLNYSELWAETKFWNSIRLSLIFTLFVVAGQFILGFALANILKKRSRFTWLGRTAVMLPWVVPPIALGLTWKWILRGGKLGLLNAILTNIRVIPRDWLSYANALGTVIAVTIWIGIPFTFMLELAGLQKIPDQLYEAASIDGAGKLGRFFYITIPQMKSTFLINLIMITISTIGYFDIIFALTNGGPNDATEVLPLFMYHAAFKFHQLGRGAAMSVFMLMVSLILTLVYLFIFREKEALK